MPKTCYVEKRFQSASLVLIAKCNTILERYAAQGYDMTLRQLYYQLVASDVIKNSQKSYNNLGALVSEARLAGLIDWGYLVDRTRSLRGVAHWESPEDIIRSAALGFRIDKWKEQAYRIEIWIEKEALAGVFERIASELDVPFFSCRGYNSQSEMWRAAQRLESYQDDDQTPIILHFGDHDPSGQDMTRDIEDRLAMFMGYIIVERLALNMDQVEKYNPPPNPVKLTDSRMQAYIRKFGNHSWELDALPPDVLADLVRQQILSYREEAAWEESVQLEEQHRSTLGLISENYAEVQDFVYNID